MNIDEAEKITTDFGKFYTERGSLVVLKDGTTANDYEGLPYFSVWDLPYSVGKIKYAYYFVGEYAFKHPEMYGHTPRPYTDILSESYKLLADFIEDAHEINQEISEIERIPDSNEMDFAILKFEAKHKLSFYSSDGSWLWVEYRNFLADLNGNWHTG